MRIALKDLCHRQRGFTLLELLLATAMVAVIAATLFMSMGIAFRARASAYNQVQAVRQASIAMDLVTQDLQSVVKPGGVLAGPFVGLAMGTTGGEADSIEFHTLGRDDAVVGDNEQIPFSDGIRRVEFILRKDVDPPALVRRVETNLLATNAQEPIEEPIARNVRAFGVRYYDGYGWSEEWDSTLRDNALPLAVEVTIVFDLPSPTDSTRPYSVMQIIPLSCAQPPADTLGLTGALGG